MSVDYVSAELEVQILFLARILSALVSISISASVYSMSARRFRACKMSHALEDELKPNVHGYNSHSLIRLWRCYPGFLVHSGTKYTGGL